MKEKKKLTNLQILKRVLTPKTLVILILLLAANSFAWFIYINRVDNDMEVFVRAWRVLFESGDEEVTDYLNINIDAMYPGMEEYYYDLTAYNMSDVPAHMSYQILEVTILGNLLLTVEGRAERGESPNASDLTSVEMAAKLATDYPFSILFNLTTDNMAAEVGVSTYETRVNWPFESGDDVLDTQWGTAAFNYREANPSKASIILRVKISIVQSTG